MRLGLHLKGFVCVCACKSRLWRYFCLRFRSYDSIRSTNLPTDDAMHIYIMYSAIVNLLIQYINLLQCTYIKCSIKSQTRYHDESARQLA